MTAEPRVLVTRPAGQAGALIEALSRQGFVPVHLPVLEIEALDPLPGSERQRVLDLDRYQQVLFVSANAARLGLERFADYWPQLPLGQSYLAVGESSARVLEEAGLRVERPVSDMSTEGLLELPGLADLSGQRVLIVKGEGGREALASQLRERGAEVDALHCYRRVSALRDEAQSRALLLDPPPALLLISSGEGLRLLCDLLGSGDMARLRDTRLIVPSQRVAQLAENLGWAEIHVAENASDEAMLSAAAHCRAASGASV